MAEGLLGVLANRTNQAILSLLAVEPMYPRKVGSLLSLPEAEVARRLKHMEGLGVLTSQWSYIGKNVKLYRLATEGFSLRVTPEGLRLEFARAAGEEGPAAMLLTPFAMDIPHPGDFVGRARELALLEGPEPAVVVVGMPGIGKTALLARHAHGLGGRRAVFWHSFCGVESLNWLANRMAVFLARHGRRELLEAVERGAEPADKRELLLRAMDDPSLAFLLDDAHLVQDEAVAQFLTDALQRVRRGKLVVASRQRPRYDPSMTHVRLLELGGLGDEDVARFLETQGLKATPEVLRRVREEVGGHPLALHLLLQTARETRAPLEAVLDRVPEQRLEDYLLEEVYAHLAEDEREVLAHASVFRTLFTLDELRALTRRDPEAALLRLRRRMLVQAFGGEYALHEVVRNFYYQLLKNKRDLHEKAAAQFLAEGTVEGRLESMHHLLAAGRKDRVLVLLEQNLDFREFDFIDAGYRDLYLDVLELYQRGEVQEPRRWALIEDEKGDLRFHRGEVERALAHYGEAHALFRDAKDLERVADVAWKRAMALAKLGRAEEARAVCDEALRGAPGGEPARRLRELRATLKG